MRLWGLYGSARNSILGRRRAERDPIAADMLDHAGERIGSASADQVIRPGRKDRMRTYLQDKAMANGIRASSR